jgi:hypothetical protein
VARGSHANYFAPGSYPVPECPLPHCRDHADGAGLLLFPGDYQLVSLDGARVFSGDWGSGNFSIDGFVRIGSGINVADPQEHTDQWNHPAAWVNAADPGQPALRQRPPKGAS